MDCNVARPIRRAKGPATSSSPSTRIDFSSMGSRAATMVVVRKHAKERRGCWNSRNETRVAARPAARAIFHWEGGGMSEGVELGELSTVMDVDDGNDDDDDDDV